MSAYSDTEVAVSKSQEQIRNILRKYGVQRVNFGESFNPDGSASVGVEFVHQDTMVRLAALIALPDPDEMEAKARRSRGKNVETVTNDYTEQEAKRIWRVLHWAIKVRMEAIAEGLETFEQSFLAHIVDPGTDRTLWEWLSGSIQSGMLKLGGGGLRAISAGKG